MGRKIKKAQRLHTSTSKTPVKQTETIVQSDDQDQEISENASVIITEDSNDATDLKEASPNEDEMEYEWVEAKSKKSKNKESAKKKKIVDSDSDDFEPSCKKASETDFDKLVQSLGKRKINYIRVEEIEGDLFEMPEEYALAHCVAEDLNMGSGIAVTFKQTFKRVDELANQKQRQGGLAFLKIKNRYIYYLVTKKLSSGKPTLHTMWSSLQKLKSHMVENRVKKLAIPRLACGLDRLEWSRVKAIIEDTFTDTNIEIKVCNFQQNYGKTKQKLKQTADPPDHKGTVKGKKKNK